MEADRTMEELTNAVRLPSTWSCVEFKLRDIELSSSSDPDAALVFVKLILSEVKVKLRMA